MSAATREACRTFRPELVIVSQLQIAPYALGIQNTPAILEEIEFTSFAGFNDARGAR